MRLPSLRRPSTEVLTIDTSPDLSELSSLSAPNSDVTSARSESSFLKLSESGKFHSRSFVVNRDGMHLHKGGKEEQLASGFVAKLTPLGIAGRGASGIVRRARGPDGTMVALKEIRVSDEAQQRQVLNELRLLRSQASAQTSHLVLFLGVSCHEGSIRLAMEYMDSGSLADVLHSAGRLTVDCTGAICHQILLGLEELRQLKLVHRDLKPQNVLLNRHGECKLSDFGCASLLPSSAGQCSSFVGTLGYMSPERLDGKEYSHSSDIWSLGCILMECLVGKLATPRSGFWDTAAKNVASEAESYMKEFSSEVSDFVLRCMTEDPKARERLASAPLLLKHEFINKHGATSGFRLDTFLRELSSGSVLARLRTSVLDEYEQLKHRAQEAELQVQQKIKSLQASPQKSPRAQSLRWSFPATPEEGSEWSPEPSSQDSSLKSHRWSFTKRSQSSSESSPERSLEHSERSRERSRERSPAHSPSRPFVPVTAGWAQGPLVGEQVTPLSNCLIKCLQRIADCRGKYTT